VTIDSARSAQMALVRARDTKPEMRVRRALHAAGLRYVLHDRRLPGAPDLVFPSRGVVIFVHGCFWHRHPGCKNARLPKSRLEFWEPKLASNVSRDQRQLAELRALGWKVLVIWECETKHDELVTKLARTIKRIRTETRKRPPPRVAESHNNPRSAKLTVSPPATTK